MDLISRRSFRIERGSSLKLGRSNSTLLASELDSSDISRFAGYERLSESMRFTNEPSSNSFGRRRRRNRAWGLITKAFSFRKIGGGGGGGGGGGVGRRELVEKKVKPPQVAAVGAAEKKKTRSSWLPDRNRRWPVQGW